MHSLVSKMMLALGAILVATVLTLGVFTSAQLHRAEVEQLDQQADSLHAAFDAVVDQAMTTALVGATTLGSMPEVVDAFAARDRERLQAVTLPIFREVQEQGIWQMQFHLPDSTSFLRLHQPDHFGDDLSAIRYTVPEANRTRRPVSGLEEGVHGWGIRTVIPIERGDQHLGTLEYGYDFGDAFLKRLQTQRVGRFYLYQVPSPEQDPAALRLAGTDGRSVTLPDRSLLDRAVTGSEPVWERRADQLIVLLPVRDFHGDTRVYLVGVEPVELHVADGRSVVPLVLGLATILILAVTWGMLRWSLAPLKRLAGRLTALAQGTFGPEIPVTSHDEVGVITDAFNRMARGLRARYQALVEHAGEIVLFTRPTDGQILEANEAAARAYGYTREELTRMNIRELRPASTRALVPEQLHQAVTTEGGIVFETIHRRHDGGAFPVEVYAHGIEAEGEQILVSLIRDITRHRQRETIGRLATEMNHRILQNHPRREVLGSIADSLVGLYQLDLIWIGSKDSSGAIAQEAIAGWATALLARRFQRWDQPPEESGPSARAIQTGLVQIGRIADLGYDDPASDLPSQIEHLAYLAIPLRVQQKAIGTLTMVHHAPGGFSSEQITDLQVFANQMAVAMLTADVQANSLLRTAALEAAANAIAIVNRDGTIKWANAAFARMTGYTVDEVIGANTRILKSGTQSQAFYAGLWETVLSGNVWRGELQNRRKNGDIYTEEMTITPVRGPTGEVDHFIAVKQDVTDRKRQEEQLREATVRDPLTGLPNRRALEDYLAAAVSRAQQGNAAFLLLIDVDRFRLINEALGYPVGDYLLCEIARRLQSVIHPSDLLARIGPDEFAILANGLQRAEAEQLAERIHQEVSGCTAGQQVHMEISASVGAVLVDGRLDTEDLLETALTALTQSKEQGQNRTTFCTEVRGAGPAAGAGARMARYLTDSVHLGHLLLHYQPVVSLTTGLPEHYEALIRLRGPEGELLPPSSFLPVAEQYRLMPVIDRWVVGEALGMLYRHPALRLFVNLSGQTLGDAQALEAIEAQVLQSEKGVVERLTFEVTETTAVRDLGLAQSWMKRLIDSGCRFALDDFGTGFSSFQYLRLLPVSYVKIDGSFIRNLHEDAASRSMVKAITTVAHTLGKMVVAEWVESDQVLPLLRGLGVEYGQGYGLGRPGPLEP